MMDYEKTIMNEDSKRPCVFKDKGGHRTPWSIADKVARKQAEISYREMVWVR
ncbi:MAG: hypothetical protein KAS32_14380 [Candidatus Peribacteraceae bacterium]|nr:hypothetical protein [Candidatus Peribacteraceae bacterium]